MAFLKYDPQTETNQHLKYPNANYRIHLFEDIHFVDETSIRPQPHQQPAYLGELEGWTNFSITEELNNIDNSATITYSPQLTASTAANQLIVLATPDGKALTTKDGKFLVITESYTDPIRTRPFQDDPVDYGVFVLIENHDLTGATTDQSQTLFTGMIVSWEQDLATQNVTIRLVGLSNLGGNFLIKDVFWRNLRTYESISTPRIRANNNRQTYKLSPYDHYVFEGINVMVLLERACFYNTYLRLPFEWVFYEQTATNTAPEFRRFTLDALPDDARNVLVNMEMGDRSVKDFFEEVWEYLPNDWHYRIDYNQFSSNGRLRPTIVLGKTIKVFDSVYRLRPDYVLRAGENVVAQSLNFSGERQANKFIVASGTAGTLTIDRLSRPSTNSLVPDFRAGAIRVVHRLDPNADYETVSTETTDENGKEVIIETQKIKESSEYRTRLISGFPAGPDNTAGPLIPFAVGNFNDKAIQDKRGRRKTFNVIRPVFAEFQDPINNRPDVRPVYQRRMEQEMSLRRNRTAEERWTPRYTGSISVVGTDERPLYSYKVGQQVGFAGFNSVLDDVVAQIVAITYTPFTANISLSFVLPNVNRRLKRIENDRRNA